MTIDELRAPLLADVRRLEELTALWKDGWQEGPDALRRKRAMLAALDVAEWASHYDECPRCEARTVGPNIEAHDDNCCIGALARALAAGGER